MMLVWQLAALFGGTSSGLLGFYILGLRMPFLGIGIAHAAMMGAVFAKLLGWPEWTLAFTAAMASAAFMGRLASSCARADLNTLTSILLSLTMGLAFLGMGLYRGEASSILGLMWGSLLFVQSKDLFVMGGLLGLLCLFIFCFRRPLDAILFSPVTARACGIQVQKLLMLFLVLAAATITLNLNVVGGMMMYSLLTNPAAAALELATSMNSARLWAISFGALSALGGFWISWMFELPTGACIVLASTGIYGLAVMIGRNRMGLSKQYN